MTTEAPIRDTWPPEMDRLIDAYPRDGWEAHPHLARATREWMAAHGGFRQIARVLGDETRAFLDRAAPADAYARRLGRWGDRLVRNLHGHHGWEDRSFFPEIRAADRRFDGGLELLEADHARLDAVLDRLTRASNRAIMLIQMDEAQARDEAGDVLGAVGEVEALLARHLTDEEDLIVPILLHHRLRG